MNGSLASTGTPLPAWKRTIDLCAVAAALPVLGAASLLMAVLARVHSPGPIFYRQQRIGHRGRPFELLKFRTMHVAAPSAQHRDYVVGLLQSDKPMQKLDDSADERLIRGSWLFRASGLDELPQILNVLRGEMSLVGPRPCLPYEYEQYTPEQRHRFDVLPGLTGLWQVSGKNQTSFRQMIALDLAYARDLSLVQDLTIIARTFPTLFGQVGAAVRRRLDRPVATRAPAASANRESFPLHSPSHE